MSDVRPALAPASWARPTSHATPAAWLGPSLILATISFNPVLCFINTRHWALVGTPHIIALSVVIVAVGALSVRADVTSALAKNAFFVVVSTLAIKLVNPAIDLKILFDIAIVPVFYLLGRRSSFSQAERILSMVMAIVLSVGLFELVWPEAYQQVFDILTFYTVKGSVDLNAVNYAGTNFFTSAERSVDAGRTLLPGLLGPHRVASVFLEPISMGNFPLISLSWLLSVPARWGVARWLLAGGTVLCVILPDSRLAVTTCGFMGLSRLVTWNRSRAIATALPVLCLLGLVGAGWLTLGDDGVAEMLSDDLQGRLSFSGQLLASWGWAEWLALAPSPLYTLDTGYAYLISNLGLPISLMLWLQSSSRRLVGAEGQAMRGMVALYTATSLCIGGSMFSIKTAALLWFLVGAAEAGAVLAKHDG